VLADVASHKYHAPKGFHYFDLVEKGDRNLLAKVNAVAWTEGASRIREFERLTGQRFGDDIHVLVCVRVDYHPVYGLKLTLVDIDARFTLGQLEAQRQAVLERLLREMPNDVWLVGDRYKTTNAALRLPKVIQRIAVVASERSAGYEDFRHSLESQHHGFSFKLTPFDTLVQGPENAGAIVRRLNEIAGMPDAFDAVVIVRGGGAQTDLLIFDQYEVAAAVAALHIPVFTGIGHLRNETITDLMAHTASKTPTECAEHIIAHNRNFEDQLMALRQRIILRAQQQMNGAERAQRQTEQRLTQTVQWRLGDERTNNEQLMYRLFHAVRNRISEEKQTLGRSSIILSLTPERLVRCDDALQQQTLQLNKQVRYTIEQQQRELTHLTSIIRLSSPDEALKRGFAILKKDGKIITDPSPLNPGDEIDITLKDTEITTRIIQKSPRNGNEFDL
jgi:exodeoxyribonuclease VII large subunit